MSKIKNTFWLAEEKKIHLELDEDKILGDFRLAIQRTRSVQHLHHHHYGPTSSNAGNSNLANINNRTSSRNNINNSINVNNSGQLNSASKSKLTSIEIKASKYVSTRNGETTTYTSTRFVSTNANDPNGNNSINKSLRNLNSSSNVSTGSLVGKKKNAILNDLGKRSLKKMKLDSSDTIKVIYSFSLF